MKEFHMLLGHLTRDAEQREIGESVVFNFTIAVDGGYTDKNGNWVEQTKFIECALWRSKKSEAAIKYSAERLVKGNCVQITSRDISARAYQERDNGQPKYDSNGDPVLRTVLTVRVADIEHLKVDKSRLSSQNGQQGAPAQAAPVVVAQSETADTTKDDLPF